MTRAYQICPKDPLANLQYRHEVLKAAREHDHIQETLRLLCARDVLFFVNTFVYVIEPRRKVISPFVTWEMQDEAFDALTAVMGREDLDIFKSRDVGATWIVLSAVFHQYLFAENFLALLGSRRADLVDSNDQKSLMGKIDFLMRKLPSWLLPNGFIPRLHRNTNELLNPENGNVINGEATVGDFARGDRRTLIAIDEFGAIRPVLQSAMLEAAQDATDCLVLMGTAKHKHDKFAERWRSKPVRSIFLPWWRHPEKSKGLYTNAEGKRRSPAYDHALKRSNNDTRKMAREWDCEFDAADTMGFDLVLFDAMRQRDVRNPLLRGWLAYDSETLEIKPQGWREDPNGEVSLWIRPDQNGRFPGGQEYVAGADISTGLASRYAPGKSNSVLYVFNRRTGELVASIVTASRVPTEFADVCIALCNWFGGGEREDGGFRTCFMNWEANGPVGRLYGKRVLAFTGNVYYRDVDVRGEDLREKKQSKPGWWNPPDGANDLLKELEAGIRNGQIVIRDEAFWAETKQYILDDRGLLVHSLTHQTDDPALAGQNHGDRCVAAGIAFKGIGYMARSRKRHADDARADDLPAELDMSYDGRRRYHRGAETPADPFAARWGEHSTFPVEAFDREW